MRSSDLFGLLLLFLLDFWRPAEGLCSLENRTGAFCDSLEDVRFINTDNLDTLKTSVSEKILIPASFRNLSTLKHLEITKGELVEIHPGTFLQLSQLLTLNLAENHIQRLSFGSLEGLKNLKSLILRKNNIHHLPEALLDLKKLKVLDVSENELDCNCETLRVRDKLVGRGVKILKRAVCSGPVRVKGLALLKPSSNVVCLSEEHDEGMQMDQPVVENPEGSGELGSGDEELEEDDERELEEDADIPANAPEIAETPVPETPAPETSEAETPAPKVTISNVPLSETPATEEHVETTQPTSKVGFITSVSPVEVSLEKSKLKGDDGLFFDNEEKSSTENPSVIKPESSSKNDDLVSTVEGSGDDDEFEGSGTLVPPIDFGKSESENVFENTEASEKEDDDDDESLFEKMFGSWSDTPSTTTPQDKTESEIVQEEFLPVIPMKASEVEGMLAKNMPPDTVSFRSGVDHSDVIKGNETLLKNGETRQEIADASSQDTKMGNGSMVVLVILLAVFVALVSLAAYKGDFCKKKRMPNDVERGTELKEMRKSLLEGINSAQPKITNGNTESSPLIKAPLQTELDEKESLHTNGNGVVDDTPSAKLDSSPSAPESTLDPVKPPRKSLPLEDERPATNGNSNHEPYINHDTKYKAVPFLAPNDTKTPPNTPMTPVDFGSPPLSPDAQRVKIILQDNPDSVPKTPILITRTKMGENLVKTP